MDCESPRPPPVAAGRGSRTQHPKGREVGNLPVPVGGRGEGGHPRYRRPMTTNGPLGLWQWGGNKWRFRGRAISPALSPLWPSAAKSSFHGHGSTAPGQVGGSFLLAHEGRGASCVKMSVMLHEPQDQHCGDRERKSAPLSVISCHAMSCFLVWLLRHDEKDDSFYVCLSPASHVAPSHAIPDPARVSLD